jgi:nucleotide-binding universal stress UspA family protein
MESMAGRCVVPVCANLYPEEEEAKMQIKIKKILCPVDFSECSEHAIQYAVALATAYQAEIKLVHAMDIAASVFSYSELDMPDPAFASQLLAEFTQRLEELAGKVRSQHEPVTSAVLHGRPFLEIINCAKDWQADIIVIGTHGRSGLEHMLIGSVAEKVVRKAPCPVLTVRHPEHDFVMP